MDILNDIINANGGAAVQQIGSQFGLGEQQTTSALSALIPALAAGLQKNAQSEGGLGSLIAALSGGVHQRYIENPQSLADPRAVQDGNSILGHVLGSKDVSRDVASRAAAQTGISADVMKQMLPLVATMVMGALARRSGGSAAGLSGSGGLAGMLGSMLDSNHDGSIADDVTGALGKFLKRP
ncbi:MAG: DUF937 domain-containing protein [Vicinamibacterales bacterium]